MSITVSCSCMYVECRHHNKNELHGKCTEPDLVTIGKKGQCLWADVPTSKIKESAKPVKQQTKAKKPTNLHRWNEIIQKM